MKTISVNQAHPHSWPLASCGHTPGLKMCICMMLTIITQPFFLQKYQFKSRFTNVFPLASVGIKPDPDIYRVSVGILEVVCALLLVAGTPRAKLYSLYVLLIVMIGALYTHIALHDEVKEMMGAFIAITLILTRLTLDGAISVRAKVN